MTSRQIGCVNWPRSRAVLPRKPCKPNPDSIRGEISDRRAKSQDKSVPKPRPGSDSWQNIDAVAMLGEEAAAGLAEEPEEDEEDMGYDGDPLAGEARQEIGRRLRRHFPSITPSRRLAIIDEVVGVMEQMVRCYLPQVKSIIERELGCSPYLTRQASQRLIYEVHNSSQISIMEYVELINDADFLDILRGRAMFVRVQENLDPNADDPSGHGNIISLRFRHADKTPRGGV